MRRINLDKTLYVYTNDRLNDLMEDLNQRTFLGIGFILNIASNIEDLSELEAEHFNDCIIDLTALSFDNNYYRIFLECYIYTLVEKFKNVDFSIVLTQKSELIRRFPYIFTCISEKYSKNSDMEEAIETDKLCIDNKHLEKLPLLLYKSSTIDECSENYKIISVGALFNGTENLNYQFNIDSIELLLSSDEMNYIDITQVIHSFKIRKDLILSFEIILRQICTLKKEISFLVCDENLDDIKKNLPFTFKIHDELLTNKTDNVKTDKVFLDVSKVEKIIGRVGTILKGHEDFKKDFGINLKKFVFLNELKERALFSIFLTGESGIGKTEFAKMLSEIMYPMEELIKINFGNYSNEGVLNSLIGSPLGYIGSEEGGELINKLSSSKSKIILIDEFEKATPSVFHFFYELLEDGIFTDRHGIQHNLNGYIVIFTSNMTRKKYIESIPNPLKSRFDMVYCFVALPPDEKERFVIDTAKDLIDKILESKDVNIDICCVKTEMNNLIKNNNLRNIKRKIEDIVIAKYYENTEI